MIVTELSETPDGPGEDPDRVPPASLLALFNGKAPGLHYVDAIDKGIARRPDEAERAATISALKETPAYLGKLPDLMRAAVQRRTPSGVRQALLALGSETIRALVPDQENWGRRADASAEQLLDPLVRNLRRAKDGSEKSAKSAAEALLLSGLIIITERSDFDAAGALATIYAGLHPKPGSDAASVFRGDVRKASVKTLESYAVLRRVIGAAIDEAGAQHRLVSAQLVDARDRLRMVQEDLRDRNAHVRELEAQLDHVRAELAAARSQIQSAERGANHDRFTLSAQLRGLFTGTLDPYAIEALEALEEEPFFVETARERLQMIREGIDKGLQWLA